MPKVNRESVVRFMPTEKNPDTILFVRCAEWREARAKHELVLAQNRKARALDLDTDFTDVEAYLDIFRMTAT